MKKTIFLLLLVASLPVMAKYSQVIYISATNTDVTKSNGYYQYENEDVRIVYSFWADNGIVGFMIYNKTNHPIYIDWKKSSLIYNGHQNPYYTNSATSNYNAFGITYGSGWTTAFNNYIWDGTSSYGIVNARETIVKQQRTSFIPPHSYVSNAFYNILDNIAFSLDKKESQETRLNGYPVYINKPADHISFRNFITYSASEDFSTEKYADNEFYLSKIVTMNNDYFGTTDIEGHYHNDWKKPTRFYISDIKRSDVFGN